MYKSGNKRMFRITALSCLLLVCLSMMGCATQQSKLEDGLYLAKWEGYTGITTDEKAIAYIPIMGVGTEEKYQYPQWYTSEAFSVTMDGKVVSENVSLFWPITLGRTYGDNNEYHFTYLRLTLKDLTEGVHEVTSIQVPGAKNKFVFPLHWVIEVRKPSQAQSCFDNPPHSSPLFFDNTLMIALENTCSTEVIVDGVSPTEDLEAKMYLLGGEEDYTKSTTTTATENRIGPYDQVPIAPKSLETVMVTLSPTASDKELAPFFQFNPLVLYRTVDNTDQRYTTFTEPNQPTWFPKDAEEFKATVLTSVVKGTEVEY